MSVWRHLPNALTGVRIGMVWPAFAAVAHERFTQALWLLAVAGLTDALDGWLAKRHGWTSRLGALLDPLADKLMFGGVFLAFVLTGLVPVWFGIAVVTRDLVIMAGACAYRAAIGPFEAGASGLSKLNTLLVVAFGLFVLAGAAGGVDVKASLSSETPSPAAVILGASAFATTVLSGVHYVSQWGQRALRGGTRPVSDD